MADPKVALVTGISSGIGQVTAEELVRSGFRVFGTVRSRHAVAPAAGETIRPARMSGA